MNEEKPQYVRIVFVVDPCQGAALLATSIIPPDGYEFDSMVRKDDKIIVTFSLLDVTKHTKKKIHYSGGISYLKADGCIFTFQKGCIPCVSGAKEYIIKEYGNHTENRDKVTCQLCLKILGKESK